MRTTFYLHLYYTEQVIGVKKENCLRLFYVGGCHGNNCICMRTKFHLHVCYTEQVIRVKK